jgi:hypothetical protein
VTRAAIAREAEMFARMRSAPERKRQARRAAYIKAYGLPAEDRTFSRRHKCSAARLPRMVREWLEMQTVAAMGGPGPVRSWWIDRVIRREHVRDEHDAF